MATSTDDTCQVCGGPLPEPTEIGRPRKFCSDKCRSRAHRVRQRETERTRARMSRQCDIEVAGHRCERAAVFVLAVDGRDLKVCPACQDLALAFLVGQGTSATAVETRRIDDPNTEPARAALPRRPSGGGFVVLLIDDDKRIVAALSPSLRRWGYQVVPALTGRAGLHEAMVKRPDVVLLDLGLPDLDGIDVLRKLREASDVPVIVVTARGETDDKILGFDSGADDYLVKPFVLDELVARMRRVVAMRRAARQGAVSPAQVYDDGGLYVDFDLQQVRIGGDEVRLTRREFRLLEVLVRSAGVVQSVDAIVAYMFPGVLRHSDTPHPPIERSRKRSLAVHISTLRAKLGQHGLSPNAIVTAHGIGYYYQPPNRPPQPAPRPQIGYSHAERLLHLPPAAESAK